ncbi:SSI family serine proteinase inhibitor [Nonomuraea spiralis]|uniref:SSI family serine proteinase inhibitor n=1 Tax=Nonomuraea TaxID=83681 RepID=UPI00163C254E|nr:MULTISPECIES: SSI family serine proteinase inhibitor [Nonomuraea]
MHRILAMAALSCAAFAAAPVANATTGPPDVEASFKSQRHFRISVGDRQGVLECTPGRVVPGQVDACLALEHVGGNPARLSRRGDVSCTADYQPVDVQAWGVWDGARYRYSHRFPNACELAVSTGPVFRV